MLSYSELEPVYNPSFPRANTLSWVPRWFQGYYTNDTLRKLHYLSLVSQKERLQYSTNNLTPGFYNPILETRQIFIGKHKQSLSNEVTFKLVHAGGVEIGIDQVPTLGDFLLERKNPVAYMADGILIFKNLANHTYQTTSTTGIVSLLPALASGFSNDSIIILENNSGDQFYHSRFSAAILNGSALLTSDSGVPYYVTYTNQARLTALLAGTTSKVLVDGVQVDIVEESLANSWDEAALLFDLKRKKNEPNINLKGKVQYLSFAEQEASRIASFFGQASFYQWNPLDVPNLSSSGWTSVQLLNLPKFQALRLQPYKVPGGFKFTEQISSGVLFVNQRVLQPEEYNLQNGFLTFTGSGYLGIQEQSITLQTTKVNYQTIHTANGAVSSLTSNFDAGGVLVLLTKKVKVQTPEHKIKKYPWDIILQIKEGATFD